MVWPFSKGSRGSTHRMVWITGDLAVSGAPEARAWPGLAQTQVRVALDLRAEAAATVLAEIAGLKYRHHGVREGGAPAVEELAELGAWVAAQAGEAGPVLIYCREGRGRSPMVACAALITMGHSLPAAYDILRRSHPQVAMSEAQLKALEGLATLRKTRANDRP